MHIKATGQIIFSEWLTTAANKRAESHNANASCRWSPTLISLFTVRLHKLYKPGSCSKSPLINLYYDNLVQTSDSLSAMTWKTASKKLPEMPALPRGASIEYILYFLFLTHIVVHESDRIALYAGNLGMRLRKGEHSVGGG